MKVFIISAVILMGILTMPANAGSAKEALAKYDASDENEKAIMELGVMSMYEGIVAADSMSEIIQHKQPLFCVPDKLSLTGSQLFSIVRNTLNANPKTGDAMFSLSLTMSLFYTFPCPWANAPKTN